MVTDREGAPFDPKQTLESYFLSNLDMAVKIGNGWKVYDVSQRLLPANMVSWREEGGFALITDPKTPTFVQLPNSEPAASSESHVAKFELTVEGEIEGDVVETLTGHRAEDYRREAQDQPETAREDRLKERVGQMFPRAEVSQIKIQNVDDAEKPIEIRYHMRAPYAQVTGKRILFQPVAFYRAQGSPFSASERHNPVEFPYGWSEIDRVTFTLPHDYSLDNAESPGSLSFGQTGGYDLKMTINKATNELTVTRQMSFGAKGQISYLAKDYPIVKKVFDEFHSRDRHTLSIRENQ